MGEFSGSGDYRVGPHVIRLASGQVCAHPDVADVSAVTYLDAYQSAQDAGSPVVDLGDVVTGEVNKIHRNPFTPAEEPETFMDGTEPAVAWASDATCIAGALYTNAGKTWLCIQGHTAQAAWSPGLPGLLALWLEINTSGQILPWVQPVGAVDAYHLGAMVTHLGQTWENTGSDANVWAPGVFGWTVVP